MIEQNVTHSCLGEAADRRPMSIAEVVIDYADITRPRTVAAANRDIIVAVADIRVSDCDIMRVAGIDSVRVTSVVWRDDLYSPRGEISIRSQGHVKVRRVH